MATVQTTDNNTLVLDAEVENAPMVIVYRGLGPETGPDYAYDTAEWMMGEIQDALAPDLLKKIIFVVPDDYDHDCETCIQQATAKIKTKISGFSLCGFSKGGKPLYKNLRLRAWKILGLIDPVSPSMEGLDNEIVDKYASKIRCVYGVWGDKPPDDKDPKAYTKKERLYVKNTDFHAHVKELKGAQQVFRSDGHPQMPGVFFKKFGAAFV